MKSQNLGCILALALLIQVGDAHAATSETILYSFTGATDGSNPFAGLIVDQSGNFYGTTVEGGTDGLGTVFKLTPGGVETVLSSFTGGADGSYPTGGVIMDEKGNLFGMTSDGGTGGTVYELASNGTRTVIHSFTRKSDGSDPFGGLMMDKKGNLYGTTESGGASNFGTVFKISPDGVETILYSFNGADGAYPSGSLIMDPTGTILGTTEEGGSKDCGGGGCGEVFKLVRNGKSWTETVLHFFDAADGAFPYAGLVMDKMGNLYGTTLASNGADGNVFKVGPNGTETVLVNFTGANGAQPYDTLIIDKHGNLYGTTEEGGADNNGTVFKISPNGNEKVLHSFTGDPDGSVPFAGLIEDKMGNLYGTSYGGGTYGNGGAVFKIAKH